MRHGEKLYDFEIDPKEYVREIEKGEQ